MKKYFWIFTFFGLISCSPSESNENNNRLTHLIKASKNSLYTISGYSETWVPYRDPEMIKTQINSIEGKLDSILHYNKSELISLNNEFLNIIDNSSYNDSIKNLTKQALIIDSAQTQEQLKLTIATNSQIVTQAIFHNFFSRLFVFDQLEVTIDVKEKEDGKYAVFSLLSAFEKLRPNIYFGNRDTISFSDWYRFKMSKYKGDDFREEIKIPTNMKDSIFGVYQINLPEGHLTMDFSKEIKK